MKIHKLTYLALASLIAAPFAAGASAREPLHDERAEADDAYWQRVSSGEHVPEFHFILTRPLWERMHPEPRGRRAGRRFLRERGAAERQRRRVEERREQGPTPPERDRGGPPPLEVFPPRPGGPGRRGPPPMADGTEYEYVKAAMEVDVERYEGIGLRFKGNSSFRSSGDRPRKPFKVDTNRFTEGLEFHGRTKLNFSNAFKDPTYMKEKLGYEVYRAAGLPTPEVGWARIYLTVEGRYEKQLLGLYVLIEQVDDAFIEKHYGAASKESLLMKPEGLRDWGYLGEDLSRYRERYEIKEGEENTELLERLAEFLELLVLGTDEDFAMEIADRLDLDGMASYLAATALMSSLDSFVGTPHNYYMLLDAATGRIGILPWDLNETWATFTLSHDRESLMRWDIERPWVASRRILERLFALESFRSLYLARVNHLLETFFTEKALFARLDEMRRIVEPLLEEDPFGGGVEGMLRGLEGTDRGSEARTPQRGNRPPWARPRRRAPIAVKPFIRGRIASVKKQLAGEEEGEELRGRRSRRFRPR